MNQEFVTYEQALALKELGFEEPTLYHWHNADKNRPFTNEICSPNCRPSTNSGIKKIGEENHVWSAPLKQQVFRWFREKHMLSSAIIPSVLNFRDNTMDDYTYNITGRYNTSVNMGTFEKAESACIDKLIELVKAKKPKE